MDGRAGLNFEIMISPITPTTAATPAAAASNLATGEPPLSRIPTKILKQEDFLQLLVAQLQNQDPMAPQTDTEFIGMMTQFTSLEQTQNMQSDIATMRSQQEMLQAMSMLDREVMVSSKDGIPVRGVVKGFDMEGQTPKLLIGDGRYALADIQAIRMVNQNETQN
ncbi:MAG: flagellar hook assembly protein FlgD [Verrucomicrobia bacterium]|nr:flagellar hook assembly protein FlgD [Verrucomicrobiota bacterium]